MSLFAVLVVGVVISVMSSISPAAGADFINWSAYQFRAAHGSHNAAATAVTTANAAGLEQAWKWVPDAPTMTGQPGAQLNASPTVHDGRIYIGSKTGVFYALDETTGAVIWKRFIGYQAGITCSAQGVVSTATVAPDPATGVRKHSRGREWWACS